MQSGVSICGAREVVYHIKCYCGAREQIEVEPSRVEWSRRAVFVECGDAVGAKAGWGKTMERLPVSPSGRVRA